MVDQAQLDQDVSYLGIGREEGAELAFGGDRLERETRRLLPRARRCSSAPPTRCALNREEVFGPVAAVIAGRRLRAGGGARQRHASSGSCRAW